MDLQIQSKVPDAGKSRTWKRGKDTNRMSYSGPRRNCPDAERDALRLDMSGDLRGAGQARLQSGECQSARIPVALYTMRGWDDI